MPVGDSISVWPRPEYRFVRTLASGGMGCVDLVARHEGTFFRLFAQKRLRPELVNEPDVRAMFLDEARIAGLIRHPNVVSVVDVGDDDRGPFLVMEFVEGVPLSEIIAAASARGEKLPLDVCLQIARHVAEGLHAAHELRDPSGQPLGLVHRDVSPHNILVDFDGVARLTDFGIAKALGGVSKTSTGVLKGKLGYLSPEQLRFEELNRQTDLFALGIVLFEMSTGTRLYAKRPGVEGPRRILNEPPPDLADYREDAEPELVELLFSLLAKDPAHRPPDAIAVARRLDEICTQILGTREGVDVGGYLERLFPDRRDALQREVAEAAMRPSTDRKPAARPRRKLRIAGAVMGAMVMIVVVMVLARKPTRELPATAATTNGRDERPHATAALQTPPTAAEKSHAPARVVTTPAVEPNTTTAPSKRRTAQPKTRRSTSASGVPVWEKY